MSIPDFLGAFYLYKTEVLTGRDGREYIVECQEVGNLLLPTGRIVACDGLIPDLEPFVQAVPPGIYPIVLSFAILDGSYWIACAMLRFSEATPKAWKRAATAEHDSYDWQGYSVDTGNGCFADLAAMQVLTADTEKYEHLKQEVNTPYIKWVDFHLSDLCNIVVFSSGHGDGVYSSYFGYDVDNNIVCLATDFGIIAPLPDKESETPNRFQLALDFLAPQ